MREELSAYLLGQLQEEQLEALAGHVDGCSTCQAALRTLEGVKDPLVPQLHRGPASVAMPDPELQHLLSLAKNLGPRQTLRCEPPTASPTPAAAQACEESMQLGQYRLLEKLGQGGMGAVYKALHLRLEKVVALKVLTAGKTPPADDVARFEREMRAVGKLNHPNIIRATDAGEAGGTYYLVMEFVEGTDLHKLVKELGRLPLPEACELVRQAALGLQHAHEHRLIHRDVKPSNLFLSAEGQVKVLDLGLARFHSTQAGGDDLTASGQGMGTLDYMAPEQAQDARSVDIRADVYSLGCTLYHLLASHPPFGGPEYLGPAQKLAAHFQTVPRSIRAHRPDVPDALAMLLDRMLAKQPAGRPFTPGEVAEALAPFTTGCNLNRLLAPAVASDETPRDKSEPMLLDTKPSGQSGANTRSLERLLAPPSPRPRSRMVPVLAGAILVAGLLFGAAYWLPRGNNHSQEQGNQRQEDPKQAENRVAERLPPKEDRQQESRAAKDQAPPAEKKEQPAEKPGPLKKDPDPPAEKKEKPPEKKEPPKKDPQPPPAKEPEGDLAERGVQVLKAYCYRCHGVDFKVPRYNVLDRAVLVANRDKDEQPYVVPGKPDESQIWQRVAVDEDMPPSGKKPTDPEKEVLKKWIVAGAPFPVRPQRPFKSEKDILAAVREHLNRTRENDRKHQRYFSLTHLYNNQYVSPDELRLYRAALAKLLNSLSWKQDLVVPKAIDPEETLFNVDLRRLGWDEHELWKEVLKVYPYGLTHGHDEDEKMRELATEIAQLAGTDLPLLRADWIIATASRPPLYHTLLHLPKDARELERQLKVDVQKDFLRNELARAGFITSGVSRQNRLVDRHPAVYGACWKSYDFKNNNGTGNLLKFPLGPVFDDNPFPRQAFQHAGGELIFNLPNGLQGYLLVDAKDRRIDEGPIEVVRDAQETAGTPAVVNGLSCMACHKHGVIRFEDKVRQGSAVGGDALVKVQELFRSKEDMDRLLDRDEERFLHALEEATGSFLRTGADRDKKLREFPEPVGAIARLYVKDLGVEEVALELGMEDPKKLQAMIEGNPMLRRLGLGPLTNGGSIKRDVWSSLEFTTSLFHNVARELGLGTPHVSF